MSTTSVPVTFYVEPANELGAAFLMIAAARDYIDEFTREHPERVDAAIANAQSHTTAAFALLDGDFYTEHNADPNKRD